MKQKKLLLLGGLRYLIPVIQKAKDLGIYTITCDYLPNNIAHQNSDEFHNINIIDKRDESPGTPSANSWLTSRIVDN